MPTYTNNTTSDLIILGKNGESYPVAAGASIAVPFYTLDTRFTKTAETPYYNRVKAITTVTLTGVAQNVAISLDTNYFIVAKITGTVTVFIQAEANTPAELLTWTVEDPIVQIPAKGRFNNIAVLGSGTCNIIQYNADITK